MSTKQGPRTPVIEVTLYEDLSFLLKVHLPSSDPETGVGLSDEQRAHESHARLTAAMEIVARMEAEGRKLGLGR